MNSDINTNVRLFDLVRYMRSELHEAELITDEEYGWLCHGCDMARGCGSPSPRRLEDYDEIRERMKRMELSLREMIDLNETTGDPDPEITGRAKALLPENSVLSPPTSVDSHDHE